MKVKNLTKRFSAVLLSMVMMALMLVPGAMAVTSSPTWDPLVTSGSLTINKTDGAGVGIPDTSLEYTIYKVADAVQNTSASGVVTVDYILDAGVTLTGGIVGNGSTVALPAGMTADDFLSGLPAGTSQTNTGGTGTLTFSGLPLGLYLVRETVTPAGVTVANDFLVSIPQSETVGGVQQWNYDPIAAPKNTVVDGTVAKAIAGGATLVSGSTYTASLGDTVSYEVEATLPSTFTVTPYTTYTVTDIPSLGLDIDFAGLGSPLTYDGIVVSVGGTTLTYGTDYTITPVAATATTSAGFVVELITTPPAGTTTTPGTNFSSSLTDGAVVKIAYDATLSPSATATTFYNDVQIDSKYNTSGTPVTPPPITPPPTTPPVIEVYNFALQKVDGDNSNAPLAGATFAIREKISGNYLTWSSSTGWGTTGSVSSAYQVTTATGLTNAIVSFNGIAGTVAGTIEYEIVEVSAPGGYSQLAAPVGITVDQNSTDDADTSIPGSTGYTIQVVNTLANTFTLPGTGGMGIYLYTIGGVLLIAAATLLFVRNRRKNNA